MLKTFFAVFLLAASAPATNAAKEQEMIMARLLRGEFVLVMRHANSPHHQPAPVSIAKGCRLGEGRGLDAAGFYQARAFGEILKKAQVPISKVYTSRMCRAWDTALLVANGAPVTPHDSQMTTDVEEIEAFKKQVVRDIFFADKDPDTVHGNVLLVNHSNIAPLYGAMVEGLPGEDEIASGVIYVVDPAQRKWTPVMRIWIGDSYPEPAPMLEFIEGTDWSEGIRF